MNSLIKRKFEILFKNVRNLLPIYRQSNLLNNVFNFKIPKVVELYPKRNFFTSKPFQIDQDLNIDEDLFWEVLKESLETTQSIPSVEPVKKRLTSQSEKKVFVLQLKMQYKSKARQSTTADLQLMESISLVNTLPNWKVIDSLIVSSKRSSSKEIFGSGNQEVLSKRISTSGANLLFIVIDRLTNTQVDALRRTLVGNNPDIKIYDRYTVVLEIFKNNAHSSIAKLQVALAEIPYIRHKFENRELYKTVEKKINKELELKLKTRSLSNSHRKEKNIPTISVFGYTNAGKTSFIKLLTNDEKMNPKNQLFATLDITYHGTRISDSTQDVIFIDTIGFISDIPTNLVEAFRTSLNDALQADILIHLVDLSHPDCVAQEKTVVEILNDLASEEKLKKMITVYNKCDLIKDFEAIKEDLKDKFCISCETGLGIAGLKTVIEAEVYKRMQFMRIKLKLSQGGPEIAYLYKSSIIEQIDEFDDDPQFISATVLINKVNAIKFIKLFPQVKISK